MKTKNRTCRTKQWLIRDSIKQMTHLWIIEELSPEANWWTPVGVFDLENEDAPPVAMMPLLEKEARFLFTCQGFVTQFTEDLESCRLRNIKTGKLVYYRRKRPRRRRVPAT